MTPAQALLPLADRGDAGAAKWRSRNRIGVGTEETATDAEFGVTSFRFGEQQWFAEQVLPSGRRCAGPGARRA